MSAPADARRAGTGFSIDAPAFGVNPDALAQRLGIEASKVRQRVHRVDVGDRGERQTAISGASTFPDRQPPPGLIAFGWRTASAAA